MAIFMIKILVNAMFLLKRQFQLAIIMIFLYICNFQFKISIKTDENSKYCIFITFIPNPYLFL